MNDSRTQQDKNSSSTAIYGLYHIRTDLKLRSDCLYSDRLAQTQSEFRDPQSVETKTGRQTEEEEEETNERERGEREKGRED